MNDHAGRQRLACAADRLHHVVPEVWMAIFDEDKSKTWEEKLYNRDIDFNGKTLHVVGL